jgi:1-acyl-sn-glycerol-3-phosphate acyltransferase
VSASEQQISYPLLQKHTPLTIKLLHYAFILVCKFILRRYCSVKVVGKQNLPSGPFIICSNHNSHMDSGVLMLSSALPFKHFGMVAAKDYFFNKGKNKGWLGLMMNLIPIERKATRQSIKSNVADCKNFLMQGGKYLIIYPEGTRSVTGKMRPFKNGAALIAVELSIPIVPVYIAGTYKTLPKGKKVIRPGKIQALIGKPIISSDSISNEQNHATAYKQVTKNLQKAIETLREKSINGKQDEADEMVGLG